MGIGLMEGIGASAGTPYVVAGGAGVVALNITSAPSKKPSMGVPMEAEISLAVGWYTEIGSGLSWKAKEKKKGTRPSITSDDVERDMDMRQLVAHGKGNMAKEKKKKEGRKGGDISQTRAHQVI